MIIHSWHREFIIHVMFHCYPQFALLAGSLVKKR